MEYSQILGQYYSHVIRNTEILILRETNRLIQVYYPSLLEEQQL